MNEATPASPPPMRIREGKEDLYQSLVDANKNGAGSLIIDFANRWAGMMESLIDEGMSVADAANATEHQADTMGFSGSMWGFGYATIRDCWEHGEAFQAWGAQKYPVLCGDPGQESSPAEQDAGPTMTQSI